MKHLSHIGDILAIPFFLALVIYFYKKEHKTKFEYILFYFAIAGFVLDIYFTLCFLRY